jgi:hypothetical protein
MDWGRLPYGAGNHAWRPEREYWQTMADLAEIGLGKSHAAPYVHVCGEAYSDYHGFIEGSLCSAVYILTKIFNTGGGPRTGDVIKSILGALGVKGELLEVLDIDQNSDHAALPI